MERPKTQYAKSGDLHVAYQTLGQGAPDIVFVAPYITHLEAMWEIPQLARYLEGLARIGRLLLFDAVGSGLSDPLPGGPRTLDSWTNDVRTVMDAVGLTRGAIHWIDTTRCCERPLADSRAGSSRRRATAGWRHSTGPRGRSRPHVRLPTGREPSASRFAPVFTPGNASCEVRT
jgi:hypothetical protein